MMSEGNPLEGLCVGQSILQKHIVLQAGNQHVGLMVLAELLQFLEGSKKGSVVVGLEQALSYRPIVFQVQAEDEVAGSDRFLQLLQLFLVGD